MEKTLIITVVDSQGIEKDIEVVESRYYEFLDYLNVTRRRVVAERVKGDGLEALKRTLRDNIGGLRC